MNILARRKIVFVIVEGLSDETALGKVLSNIYNKNYVYTYVMRCDITTQKGIEPSNIVAEIGMVVKRYANNNHFKSKDFQEIIHITDTDGVYIPSNNVIYDELAAKPVYTLTQIRTANIANIVRRNKQKSDNMDRLVSCNKIWNIPYKIYYMSCNLDHVLYDELNTSNEEKEINAYNFAKQYNNDVEGFINYIGHSDFSVVTDYKNSWSYIRQDINSLQRHTNLGICIEETKNQISN